MIKISKFLLYADVIKDLKLKNDKGITRVSLENAEKIVNAGYKFKVGTLVFRDTTDVEFLVNFAKGSEKFQFAFSGFSAGYSGEGPKGLAQAMKIFKIRDKRDWDFDRISKLKPGTYRID